ncbi:MAG: STAS domain-containing protein [Spirochaetes bacterium]|nr:STAS domain-containing protein [Spirochaetota bacterium]
MGTLYFEECDATILVRMNENPTCVNLARMEREIESLIKNNPSRIAMDCSCMKNIDAAVIAFLLKFNTRLKRQDIDLVLCGLSRDMIRKLDILTVLDKFTIQKDDPINGPQCHSQGGLTAHLI